MTTILTPTKPTYRMSQVGAPPRVLYATRLGMEKLPDPPYLTLAGRESTRHEQWVKEDMREQGYEIEDAEVCPKCLNEFGEERRGLHVELEYELFRLLGHMDGRLPVNSHKRILEVKALGRFNFYRFMQNKFAAFPKYADQLTCYFEAEHSEWPALYVVKCRDTGRIEPMDTYAPSKMQDIVDKLTFIEAHARIGKLVDCECTDWERATCQFRYLCESQDDMMSRPTTEPTDEVLRAIDFFKKYHDTASKMEKIMKDQKEIVKAWMQDAGIKSASFSGVSGRIYDKKGWKYDNKATEALLTPEQLEKCRKPTSFPALYLKMIGEKKSDEETVETLE